MIKEPSDGGDSRPPVEEEKAGENKAADVSDAARDEGKSGDKASGTTSENAPKKGPPRFEARLLDFNLKLVIDSEKHAEEDIKDLVDQIQESLKTLGVKDIPRRADLQKFLVDKGIERGALKSAVLLQGVAPIAPIDGCIEWASDFFDTGFVVDEETGAADYRQHRGNPSVAEEQLLCTVTAPVSGTEGKDVLGKRMKVAKAYPARIKAGAHVRFDESELKYISTVTGRVRWLENTLSVDDVYTITGSVGLKTGHVSHPGAVVISEDILEGSKVEAVGDIEVYGVIEGSDVRAGGDLVVGGGITGREGSHVVVGGNLHAKFLLDAHVKVKGDVIVEREIIQSDVFAGGNVIIASGRVVGGKVLAQEGMTVGHAGTEKGVATSMFVAENHRFGERITELETEEERLLDEIDRIRSAVGPLAAHIDSLPPKKQAAVKALLAKISEEEEEIARIQETIEEVKEQALAARKGRITITTIIYGEVILGVAGQHMRTKSPFKGPAEALLVHGELKLRAKIKAE